MTFIQSKLQKVDVWVLVSVLVIGCMLATLSVMRYRGYNASMLDLGNMAQAIWSVTEGRPLEGTYRDGTLSRLALHAEVVYFLIAPLYAIFPSPVTLLIFQALLFTSAGIPLYLLAYRKLQHVWASRFLVLVYLFYPVAQTAVLFDFHGDTLAMPLLVFMLEALDRRSWRAYACWLILALSCKFYVSAAVVGLGITLFLQGKKKVAGWTMASGLFWGLFAFFVLKPLFTPNDVIPLEATSAGYFATYFGHFRELLIPANFIPRLTMVVLVVGPALWLGWRGWRWFLPAGAIILPAISTIGVVAAYDYRFHHYAIAVPFLVRSILAGAVFLRKKQRSKQPSQRIRHPWYHEVVMQTLIIILFTGILIDIPINLQFWLNKPWWGLDSWAYGRTSRDAFLDSWLEENVPPKVPLMTTGFIAPHVINRRVLYMPLTPTSDNVTRLEKRLEKIDVVVLDALFDYSTPSDFGYTDQAVSSTVVTGLTTGHPVPSRGGVVVQKDIIAYLITSSTFHITAVQDGMMKFTRNVDYGMKPITFQVDVLDEVDVINNPAITFSERIGLIDYKVHHQGDRRYTFSFTWVALQEIQDEAPYIAVSRLDGIKNARIAHIATEVLLPTDEWNVGFPVREAFDVIIPENLARGSYPLYIGWYDNSHLYAAWTDARSRVGDEILLTSIIIQ